MKLLVSNSEGNDPILCSFYSCSEMWDKKPKVITSASQPTTNGFFYSIYFRRLFLNKKTRPEGKNIIIVSFSPVYRFIRQILETVGN